MFGVGVKIIDDRLRMLVGRGVFLDRRAHTLRIGTKPLPLHDLADEETERDTSLRGFVEQCVREIDIRGAERLEHLPLHRTDLLLNQHRGQLDLVGLEEQIHHGILSAGIEPLFHLPFHVLTHVPAKTRDIPVGDTERLDKGRIDLGQNGLLHGLDGHLEAYRLAGEMLGLVGIGKHEIERALLAGAGADQAVLESRDHAARAQLELDPGGGAALEGLAVECSDEGNGQKIARRGCSLHRLSGGVLSTQTQDHRIDILLGNLGDRGLHDTPGQGCDLDLRQDFEDRRIAETLLDGIDLRLDARHPCGTQRFLHERLGEAGLDELAEDLLVHGIAIALTQHLHGYLARPESGHPCAATELLQALLHLGRDLLERQIDLHPSLQSLARLHRNLHHVSPVGPLAEGSVGC